jgi:tRNA threonylcarbamoyl adenosine modification protein YeaZ
MIIACDTSSSVCSVAVVHDQVVLQKWVTSGAQVHIEKLTPFLSGALELSKFKGIQLEALALAIGPGSFNGLRIGLATIKGLALTLGLPVIPIPSPDGLAFSAANTLSGNCRSVIFSHRNMIHFGDYQLGSSDQIITPDFSYTSWDELNSGVVDHYFGHAERGFAQWLDSQAGSAVKQRFHPIQADAGAIGRLAENRRDRAVHDLDLLEPLYNAQYVAQKWTPPQF